MGYVTQGPTICKVCNTRPRIGPDGVGRCNCPDKTWHEFRPVSADVETVVLLKRKGFDLAGCGWYYYGSDNTWITILSNSSWILENGHTKIADLRDYLRSLPDRRIPTRALHP